MHTINKHSLLSGKYSTNYRWITRGKELLRREKGWRNATTFRSVCYRMIEIRTIPIVWNAPIPLHPPASPSPLSLQNQL